MSSGNGHARRSNARRRRSGWIVRAASIGVCGQGVAELAVLLGVAAVGVVAALILVHGAGVHGTGVVSAR